MTDPLAYAVMWFKRKGSVVEDVFEVFKTKEAAEDFVRQRGHNTKKDVVALIPEATARVLRNEVERLELELRLERARKQCLIK